MGQVASHVSSYFSETKKENDCSQTTTEDGINLQYKVQNSSRTTSNDEPEKNEFSSMAKSFFSFGIEATPRRHLKRSRQTSPTGSLPQSILNILSPLKKARIDQDEYLDYPFLKDTHTVEYYKKSKIMIILRGLPGSGKSTISEHIQRKFILSKVCSADHFFMKDGEYHYDRNLIKVAHNQCKENAIRAVQDQTSVVVIDNTNTKMWEMKFYFELAHTFNYIPVVVECQTPWRRDVSILVSKNIHNIGHEIMEVKDKAFEETSPVYYGWFLNDTDSLALLEVGQIWIRRAFELPEFRRDFLPLVGVNSLEELLHYFQKPDKGFNLHCTSKYVGQSLGPDAMQYAERSKSAVGKAFEIEVVGFVMTPRTLGARIKLSSEQLTLFDKDDNEEVPPELWDVGQEEYEEQDPERYESHAPVDAFPRRGEKETENNVNGFSVTNGTTEDVRNGPEEIGNGDDVQTGNFGPHTNHFDQMNGDQVNNSTEYGSDGEGRRTGTEEDLTLSPTVNHKRQNNENGTSHAVGDPSVNVEFSNVEQTLNKQVNVDDITGTEQVNEENQTNEQNHDSSRISPSKQSWISKRKNKSPKKPKFDLPIPENTLSVECSAARETFTSEPNADSDGKMTLTRGKGSRAHFTLGCAPRVRPVATGLDLIMAIQKEKETHGENQLELNNLCRMNPTDLSNQQDSPHHSAMDRTSPSFCFSVDGGAIVNYGHGVWVIYPEEKLVAKSLFAAKF